MKVRLASLIREERDPAQRRNFLREVLQARVLTALQRAGAMIPLAFHGGTALRFLYAIPRYSEDLDFALERHDRGYDLRSYLQSIRADLRREGHEVDLKVNDRKVVHAAFIRFPGLLHELELSPHPSEALAIKLEVDTNPPRGAGLATTVVRRHALLHLQHHDRPSLLAGKLHAVLARPWTKGRDLYDLVWYLSDPSWPEPNLELLQNALEQTGWAGPEPTAESWRRVLRGHLESIDWSRIAADLEPFLETPKEIELVTHSGVLALLDRRS